MMPYHCYYANALGIGTFLQDTVIRGNDVYDPEFVLGGNQAFGFDQYSALYRKFYVKGSKISVNAIWNANTESNGCILVWADCNATAPANIQTASERCLANGGKIAYLLNAPSGVTKISHSAYTRKMLGSGYEEDNNHGTAAAGPVEQWYWHVVNTNNDATLARGAQLTIETEYDTVWSEPVLNASS